MRQLLIAAFFFVCNHAYAQSPVSDLIKTYMGKKGIAVEQPFITQDTAVKNGAVSAAAQVVTVDDGYPDVLKKVTKQMEKLLQKQYSLVSFTQDEDSEMVVKFYRRVRDNEMELVLFTTDGDGLTVMVAKYLFKNRKKEDLLKNPFTLNMNGQSYTTQPVVSQLK